MKILFLGAHDWANLCNRIARAINGGEKHQARVVTVHAHPYGYEEDWIVGEGRLQGFAEYAEDADWIISTGDGDYRVLREALRDLEATKKKDYRIGVAHAGSAFRRDPKFYRAQDDEIGARVRFVGCDSWHLMEGDPRAVPYFGTADLAPWRPHRFAGLRVSHSASSRKKKGTERILEVLLKLQAAGYYSIDLIEGMGFAEACRVRAKADIHVDQLNPEVGGFGQAAIEALGVGCAVLADLRKIDRRVGEFFEIPPIVDVRDEKEIEDWLRFWHGRRDLLQEKQRAGWEWVQTWASDEAIRNYWIGHLEKFG